MSKKLDESAMSPGLRKLGQEFEDRIASVVDEYARKLDHMPPNEVKMLVGFMHYYLMYQKCKVEMVMQEMGAPQDFIVSNQVSAAESVLQETHGVEARIKVGEMRTVGDEPPPQPKTNSLLN
jgi:hypothetical protein